MTSKTTWRADFFDDIDDNQVTRSTFIDAATEDEAADWAVAQMGNSMSVNLVRTVRPWSN